jgi:anthranilate synthase/aminodeoxychorismate synthase-like glutamine amidotransferase
MILVIDNYDSFTYNLVQYLGSFGEEPVVVRNDEKTVQQLATMNPAKVVISPGPGYPAESGVTLAAIEYFKEHCPVLGVCLGLQAIGQAMGGRIVPAATLCHGKSTAIFHDGKTLFQGVVNPFQGGRYHSLIVEKSTLPDCLEISAQTDDGQIMGLRHCSYPLEGVQFHPESILTEQGLHMIENFLKN